MRPADILFPDRTAAYFENRCVKPPMGCGKPVIAFRDALSKKEWEISRLCQVCQDNLYDHEGNNNAAKTSG